MSLQYGSLEEVHGAPFGTRSKVTRESFKTDSTTAKPEFTSIEQKSQDSVTKNRALVDSITKSLPLDTQPSTENFVVEPPRVRRREVAREAFTEHPIMDSDAIRDEKLNRILRLIEQNRTGYERPVVQDMALYVFTGVFFLFTFDTFVQLGKSMRGK